MSLPPPTPSMTRLATALAATDARLRREIEAGREVVGSFTPLAPPTEIVEAAGALPYRLLAANGADADLKGMGVLGRDTCSFCRSVLGAALETPPPVTAIAAGGACDRLRRAAEAWPAATGLPLYAVALPRVRGGPGQREEVADELRLLAAELGARTGIEATAERVAEAVGRANACREVLAAADRTRKAHPPALTGTEFLDVVRARHALDSARFLEAAEDLPDEIEGRARRTDRPVRLLLAGPTLLDDRREVVEIAEERGAAVVVADLTDSGSLGYGAPVAEEGDPFLALADSVLGHPILAAPLRPSTAFRERLHAEIAASRPDGVVFRVVPFCRPFLSEAPALRESVEVPFLDVRVDGKSGLGQVRTRVEAFIESLARKSHQAHGCRRAAP